ncbi:MAG TPA: PD-(D/E)XK motif protein, partial [Acidimicrobiales bacterium]|nr:PD-(D/E)XK motif protein [Acidimicrobiales bacterium]
CTDPTINPTFAVLADELVAEVRAAPDPREAVLAVLNRWRWFWSNRPGPLSETEALGLFAELWFLHRWLTFPDSVVWWRGPLGDRHDFVHPDISVEVKATAVRTDGPATHRITHLDQLDDPESGELQLFSLTAIPDRLATNSLTHLVEHLTSAAVGTPQENTWRERLEAARWHPAHADRYRNPLRVVTEELYRVDDAFPRITRASFPGGQPPLGVDGVTYTIDLASVATSHRVATGPGSADLDPLR